MSSKKPPKDDKNRPFSTALLGMKKKLEDEAAARAQKGQKPVKVAEPAEARARSKAAAKADPHEDAESFHRMMSGVKPLDEAKAQRLPKALDVKLERTRVTQADLAERAKTEAEQVHEHLRQLVDGASRFEVIDDGKRVEGRRVDLAPQVLRSLRRGAVPVDARLDLHGKSEGEAREELTTFLREKRARGERCVLVIHGKGEHSPKGVGVLRGEIAAWLSQGRASEYVGAFVTALADDGGEGAVYVLLRREV